MRVQSRCRTVEEFVAAFASLCDGETLRIVTPPGWPPGEQRPFEIRLAGGEVVLRGEGEVAAPSGDQLRLRFVALDGHSRDVVDCMIEFAANRAPAPRPRDTGRRAVVRVPDAAPPRPLEPIVTVRMPNLVVGAPPPMPEGVPEEVGDAAATERNATTRIWGIAPPAHHAPRYPLGTAPPPRASIDPLDERAMITWRIDQRAGRAAEHVWIVLGLLAAFLVAVAAGYALA